MHYLLGMKLHELPLALRWLREFGMANKQSITKVPCLRANSKRKQLSHPHTTRSILADAACRCVNPSPLSPSLPLIRLFTLSSSPWAPAEAHQRRWNRQRSSLA